MYCLDTNIVVDFFRGDEQLAEKMRMAIARGSAIAITILTVCELYKGVFQSSHAEEHLSQLKGFLESVNILGLTLGACEVYGRLYKTLKDSGKLSQEFYLLIASIVQAHRYTLVTRNIKDFTRFKELQVERW